MPDALLETETEFLWQRKKKKNRIHRTHYQACLNPVG